MRSKIRDHLYQKANSLTIHGINHVLNSRHTSRKVFWIITIVVSLTILSVYSYNKINDYLTYPTVVVVDIKQFVENVRFPAVTICTPVHYNKSKLRNLTHIHQVFNYDSNTETVNSVLSGTSDLNIQHMKIIEAEQIQMSREDMDELVPKAHEVIVSCYWEVFHECSIGKFISSFYHYAYGRCFTFNSIEVVNPSLAIPCSGRYCSLDLEMFVDSTQEYFIAGPLVHHSELDGLSVTISQPDHPPGSDGDPGFTVPTGHLTTVAMRRKHVKRMPPPYTTGCIFGDEDRAYLLDAHTYNRAGMQYYHDTCLSTCFVRKVLQICQCATYSLDLYHDLRQINAFKDLNIKDPKPVCDYNITENFQCEYSVWLESMLVDGGRSCGCPPRCEEDIYQLRVSLSKWKPTNDTIVKFHLANPDKDRFTDDTIKNGMAKLKVFYETLEYDTIEHMAAYSSEDLLANIGGLIGLFIGFSVITLIEIGEIFVDVLTTTLGIKRRNTLRKPSGVGNNRRSTNNREPAASIGHCDTVAVDLTRRKKIVDY